MITPRVLDILSCPDCGGSVEEHTLPEIDDLVCSACGREFPVIRHIPRFAGTGKNYAENFGAQWRMFRTVQIDRRAGHKLSEKRFFADTGWDRAWMQGKLILDAGCGAGRFTDVMAECGADVVACDLSSAVEACRETALDPVNAGDARGNVTVLQADLLSLPFKENSFDAIHCAGVIQHTADPEGVMRALIRYLKPGGRLFYNFYEQSAGSDWQLIKRLLRLWTPSWPYSRLYAFSQVLCAIFFLPSLVMSKIPVLRAFNRFLPVCSVHPPRIPVRQQYVMTLLDTIDWYGPLYELRQNHEDVESLLKDEGLKDVDSDPGRAWGMR